MFRVLISSSNIMAKNIVHCAVLVALNATEVKFEAFDRQVVYGFNGLVACSSSLITLQLSCSLDVSKFPYDTQYCPISFGAWALDRRIYNIGKFVDTQKCQNSKATICIKIGLLIQCSLKLYRY